MTAPECYRFVLGQPAVDTALCGARTWAELREDVEKVLRGPLSSDGREEVLRFN